MTTIRPRFPVSLPTLFVLFSIAGSAPHAGAAPTDLDNPAPSLSSASARQRYPWNGKVDIDISFEGRTGASYRIELSAFDEVGATNLPVRTVQLEGSPDAMGNPVPVPAPGTHRLVWNADADLPAGFVADRVTVSARLLNPIWSFESIPAIDPDDEWAPETVYHDVQTVVSYGEIEDHAPTVRCLTDEWNLEASLGANIVFSGSSMGLRFESSFMEGRGVTNPIALWAFSAATNRSRIVTLDYETGTVACDNPLTYEENSQNDVRFFSFKDDPRVYASVLRWGHASFWKSTAEDMQGAHLGNRWGDDETGSAVCSYFPNGVPFSDESSTTVPSAYDKNTRASVFFCGEAGTDRRQAVIHGGGSPGIDAGSAYSCMGNPVGRYVVPLLDGDTFFTVACEDGLEFAPQHFRYAVGRFDGHGGWSFIANSGRRGYGFDIARSKAVAMPDGERIFLGGVGRWENGRVRMWNSSTNYARYGQFPAGHPFESWARRDVTCLLPNGKYCGVDEKLGLVVVNPLTGETYVASDDPVFKKGKMGCQLLPNGKVWIIPYDYEGRDFKAGRSICGKLYEVDFGFTRSFGLSSLTSPYLKVAEGDPEPSGIKVGLYPSGGKLAAGVYAQYYKGENPVYGDLPVPIRTGYTFLGWSTDGSSTNIVSATDPVPASGIQLKAAWVQDHGGVQLWEGGPYWAETNIGAENPWDYGYYFWWGDTVGYKRENDKWVARDGSSQNFQFIANNTPSNSKNNSTLRSEGWINADGVLASRHDAAQVLCGSPWRMPTDSEFSILANNCSWIWATTNGVDGYIVRGRGDFEDSSIFLPAAGYGNSTDLVNLTYEGHVSGGSRIGRYWSSVPYENNSIYAWGLYFHSVGHEVRSNNYRLYGCTVRPVHGSNE